MKTGGYRPLGGMPTDVFAFERDADGERALVLLHFGDGETTVEVPDAFRGGAVALATHDRQREGAEAGDRVRLAPWGGVVVRAA